MGFILDGLETESYDRKYKDRVLVGRLAGYFRSYSGAMFWIIVCLFLGSVTGSVTPIVISKGIDMVASSSGIPAVVLFAGSIVMVGILGWLFNYIRQRLSAVVVGKSVLTVRSDVFKKAIAHDMSFFDEHPSGRVVSRITADTQDFSNIVALVVDVLSQLLVVGLLAVILFTISVRLTLILLAMAPVAAVIALSFRKIARKVTADAKRIRAHINAQIQESISGIMIAKNFRREQSLYDSFTKNNKQSYKVGLRRGLVLNMIFPIIGIASGVGMGLIVYFGSLEVARGNMTAGEWYLFMQAVGFFWWPLLNISSFWSQFQDGLAAAERVFALIDRDTKVRQTGNTVLDEIVGAIEFRGVTFAYNENEKVLDDFSLAINPGETVALVGHTGAGKSSIIRLVTRFYEFQGGEILIDNHDLRSLDLGGLRRHIGLVPQDPFLFTGTVADNIRYGNVDLPDDAVLEAAKRVGGGIWLDELPKGLSTDVGHRGSQISMGQRQLVALARVVLKDPEIFILDEATASVDPFTEGLIQQGLNDVMNGRTAIVIAHRLSTVKNADRIIVLEKGRIIEEGTHTLLLAKNGHYATLYNTYFRHQSLEYIEKHAAL